MEAKQFVHPEDMLVSGPTFNKPVLKGSWDEFRRTGLFLFVNQFLHVFGWSLVLECDGNSSVTNVFPARVVFRGFSEACQSEDYIKISKYMTENAIDLHNEANV